MKILIFLTSILISMPLAQSQARFDNKEIIYSEVERVVDSFIYHHNSEISGNFNDAKWKLVDKDGLIEINTNKISKIPVIKIKDFQSLNQQENRLFSLLNEKYGKGEETIDYYYSLILYWLLPHKLHHYLENPIDEDDYKSHSKYVIDHEKFTDKRTILFMIKTSFHKEIPNFISVLNSIIEHTKPDDLVYLHEIYERAIPMNILAKDLFVKANNMQAAIKELRSGDQEINLPSKETYDEDKYIQEAKSIMTDFKNIYQEYDKEDWSIRLKDLHYNHDPVIFNINAQVRFITIKSFESLRGSEEAFLEDVKKTYGYDGENIDFYYLIINYWLLPEKLMELTLTLNDNTHMNDFELELHKMALSHMAIKEYLKEFKDFNKLCKVIIALTEGKRSLEMINEWKENSFKRDHIQYGLYTHALEMNRAIEDLYPEVEDQ